MKSAQINSNNIIDLIDEIPILSILATQCKGVTVINGTQELKYKEADRAAGIYKNLKNMGAEIEYSKNKITINGRNKLYNTTIIHGNDHRIAMSFELLHLLLNLQGQHIFRLGKRAKNSRVAGRPLLLIRKSQTFENLY